jgi:hypothetical protein
MRSRRKWGSALADVRDSTLPESLDGLLPPRLLEENLGARGLAVRSITPEAYGYQPAVLLQK